MAEKGTPMWETPFGHAEFERLLDAHVAMSGGPLGGLSWSLGLRHTSDAPPPAPWRWYLKPGPGCAALGIGVALEDRRSREELWVISWSSQKGRRKPSRAPSWKGRKCFQTGQPLCPVLL